MSKWTTAQIPDQTGRTAVVTGANTGLGYGTAAARVVASGAASHDPDAQQQLWTVSEELTKVVYPVG
ncbi:hypothetical protein BST36_22940 [Mycolicibacterium moriokaense]|uniref:Short subunit dehydrogenase n=1 Tax=Mycolicibacterium moriokaense TaxID=39691 RepID=A0AAD1HHV2_9MYCO|nr:hypothetical protein BST36_22940 [Mycolicibacterium moriokaense]BBX04989.1 hypothetical protein MMOR_59250 [Mycolicibacterium moriokaense]